MTENDNFLRGFRSIPGDDKIRDMSFIDLAEALSEANKETSLFLALDREHKKRLARDTAQINLRNVLIGGALGGCFGLVGVVLGWYLRDSKSAPQRHPTSAVQQVQQGNLAAQQPGISIFASGPNIASQPIPMPSPEQANARASQSRP
jgi:hypothetical protein